MKRPFRVFRKPDWPTEAPWVPLDVLRRCLDVAPISKGPGNSCWLWEGKKSVSGYGLMTVPGPDKKGSHYRLKNLAAHRVVIALGLKRWPDKKELVCHHCDIRACVSPKHLYLGTFRSNAQDRLRDVLPEHRHVSPGQKVSDDKIREVFSLYFGPEGNGRAEFLAKHGWSIKSLAHRYGVGDIVIRHFVYGKTDYPFCLTGKEMIEIRDRYFGPYGQGSVCPKGTNVARWTVKTIAKHLDISESTVEHACIGDRFLHLKRPSLEHLKADKRFTSRIVPNGPVVARTVRRVIK